MTTVAPVAMQRNINFKGIYQSENGVPYHKSNTGLITGSGIGGLGALSHLSMGSVVDSLKKSHNTGVVNITEEELRNMEKMKKYAIPFALIAAAMSIGCGVIVDNIRNKKAAETADVVASSKNINEAFMRDENLQVDKYGLPYHHSNTGTKSGALLGAACGIAHGAMSSVTSKSATNIIIMNVLSGAATMALAGWGVGALYDKTVNGKAQDASMKIYARQAQM